MFLWPYNFPQQTLHKTRQDTIPLFPYTFTTFYKIITSDRLQCNCKTVCTRRLDVTLASFVTTPNHSIKLVRGGRVIVSHYTLISIMIRYELQHAVVTNCQYTYYCPPCMASRSVPISNLLPSTPPNQPKPILNTNVWPSTCSMNINTITCLRFLSYVI